MVCEIIGLGLVTDYLRVFEDYLIVARGKYVEIEGESILWGWAGYGVRRAANFTDVMRR